ncbi:MAG: 3-methyl-2-oxobutanoate hydroxymethyltransferase [Sedimentisphaerales bacterium]|nr:3-methyl-2-oxobutanoate hydroxymethyltransferase [Sedimentisphaerales bacterium]
MAEKITLGLLKRRKQMGRPFAALTCYDYAMAVLLQEAGIECILVGDSLAQVVLGHPTTWQARLDIMLTLTAAVRRGAPQAYLVGDMPFLSYQINTEEAIRHAGRFLQEAGCDAVKFELSGADLDLVKALSRAGIPVMAHLGYKPQYAGRLDSVVQARTADQARQLLVDAEAMVDAGACSILLECVTACAARAVTERVCVPVIGCGSGPYCDGQVLVLHDVLGLPGAQKVKFCREFVSLTDPIRQAVETYCREVRQGTFPDDAHSYHMKPDELPDGVGEPTCRPEPQKPPA